MVDMHPAARALIAGSPVLSKESAAATQSATPNTGIWTATVKPVEAGTYLAGLLRNPENSYFGRMIRLLLAMRGISTSGTAAISSPPVGTPVAAPAVGRTGRTNATAPRPTPAAQAANTAVTTPAQVAAV